MKDVKKAISIALTLMMFLAMVTGLSGCSTKSGNYGVFGLPIGTTPEEFYDRCIAVQQGGGAPISVEMMEAIYLEKVYIRVFGDVIIKSSLDEENSTLGTGVWSDDTLQVLWEDGTTELFSYNEEVDRLSQGNLYWQK